MNQEEDAKVNENPLTKYYRIPSITTKIPTNGRFMPKGTISFDSNGQIPVYPMRASDELLLQSPDALMSGVAVEELLKSCIPSITEPLRISAPDLDVLLIAIRAATYGNQMGMEVECPECNVSHEYECDLKSILSTVSEIPTKLELRLSDDVIVSFKPHDFGTQTELLLDAHNEHRKTQELNDPKLVISKEKKQQLIRDTFAKVKDFQYISISNAIEYVSVPEGIITDNSFIRDFVGNMPKDWSDLVIKEIEKVNSTGIDRTVPVECSECGHKWKSELEFNPSTFFEPSSSD